MESSLSVAGGPAKGSVNTAAGSAGIENFAQYARSPVTTQHYCYALKQLLLAATELPLRRREAFADLSLGLSLAETADRYGISTRRAGRLRKRTFVSLRAYRP